jgi:hypothetical protein
MNSFRLSLERVGRGFVTTDFLRRLILAPFARLLSWKGLVWSKAGMQEARGEFLLSQAYAHSGQRADKLYLLVKGCRNWDSDDLQVAVKMILGLQMARTRTD